jgi:hypothetical protein
MGEGRSRIANSDGSIHLLIDYCCQAELRDLKEKDE